MHKNILQKIYDGPVEFIGSIDSTEDDELGTFVYYSVELNLVYVCDNICDTITPYTHEEFINLCDMRKKIEALA